MSLWPWALLIALRGRSDREGTAQFDPKTFIGKLIYGLMCLAKLALCLLALYGIIWFVMLFFQ